MKTKKMKNIFAISVFAISTVGLYLIPFLRADAKEEYKYILDSDGIDTDSEYVIVHKSDSLNYNDRILYHLKTKTNTDQVKATYKNENEISLLKSFSETSQLWKFTGNKSDGYTIQNLDDNKYLNITEITNSRMSMTTDAQKFNIELNTDGTITICRKISDKNICVNRDDGNAQFKASDSATKLYLFKKIKVETNDEENIKSIKYQKQTSNINSGSNYIISFISNNISDNNKPETGNRILYHATDANRKNKSDQVTGIVEDDTMNFLSLDKYPKNNQIWRIVGNEKDGYTIMSDIDTLYLSAISTTDDNTRVPITDAPKRFHFEKNSNGTFYIYAIVNNKKLYIAHEDGKVNNSPHQFTIKETPTELTLYKETEIEPIYATPTLSGKIKGQLFNKSSINTKVFRIPALITLNNGMIVASGDVRWGGRNDSPANIDTISAISSDDGQNWKYEISNYFADMSNNTSQHSQQSASYIDTQLVEYNNEVLMAVDVNPTYSGLMSGNKMGKESTGFDSKGRLLLSKSSSTTSSTSLSDYTYYVDVNSKGVQKQVNSKKITLFPIMSNKDEKTSYYIDNDFNVYYQENDEIKASYVNQIDTNEVVQKNIFYSKSQWKVYPCFYTMIKKAKVISGNLEWYESKLINVKNSAKENFLGISPGRGITVEMPNKKTRIIFTVYDNSTGKELASTIYSDDGGQTWKRGERAASLGEATKGSESQIIKLDDETLRMYSRNENSTISYADSKNFGKTWSTYKLDKNLSYTGNCMFSIINFSGTLTDSSDNKYSNLVLMSYPKNSKRQDGVIRLGNINDDGTVKWLNDADVKYPGQFSYSVLTQLQVDEEKTSKAALFYEKETDGDIVYQTFDIEDLVNDYKYESKIKVSIDGVNYKDKVYDEKPITNSEKVNYSNKNITNEDVEINFKGINNSYNSNQPPTDAGEYKVTYKIKDNNKFYYGEKIQKFTIKKAKPTYTLPGNLQANINDEISSVKLPDGFIWKNSKEILNKFGKNKYEVKFTPTDTKNYETIDSITVEVDVKDKILENSNTASNPNTFDNINYYIIGFILSIIGIIYSKIKLKKSK